MTGSSCDADLDSIFDGLVERCGETFIDSSLSVTVVDASFISALFIVGSVHHHSDGLGDRKEESLVGKR